MRSEINVRSIRLTYGTGSVTVKGASWQTEVTMGMIRDAAARYLPLTRRELAVRMTRAAHPHWSNQWVLDHWEHVASTGSEDKPRTDLELLIILLVVNREVRS